MTLGAGEVRAMGERLALLGGPKSVRLARAQLRTYPQRVAAQRRHMRALTRALEKVSPAFIPPYESPGTERVWLNYVGRYFPDA